MKRTKEFWEEVELVMDNIRSQHEANLSARWIALIRMVNEGLFTPDVMPEQAKAEGEK